MRCARAASLYILAFNVLLLLDALTQSMMRCRAKSQTLEAFGHRLQLQPFHYGKLANLQGLLQVGELLRDFLALAAQGGELGFHRCRRDCWTSASARVTSVRCTASWASLLYVRLQEQCSAPAGMPAPQWHRSRP